MPLVCKLFTLPFDPKLEACLIDDAAHVTPGTRGEHVRKIQIALNRLNEGPGRPNTFLIMDGAYGSRTADAVKKYKKDRDIRQPWQATPDDIVGKRTIESLDTEMEILENTVERGSEYVSLDWRGEPHDHSRCPPFRGGSEWAPTTPKTISHSLTPINPIGTGRMISIGGQGEAQYVGFVDCVPDPACDPDMPASMLDGRLLTSSIQSGTVSDICCRSAPLDRWMQTELKRICMIGARLTFVGDCFDPNAFKMKRTVDYIKTIGHIVEYGDLTDSAMEIERQYVVAVVHSVDYTIPKCNGGAKAFAR